VGLAGLLLILVGFVAELIVSQGDRLAELEWRVSALMSESGYRVPDVRVPEVPRPPATAVPVAPPDLDEPAK
jgi:hypothetical protein